MTAALVSLLFGLLNALRGRDKLSDPATAAIMALLIVAFSYPHPLQAVLLMPAIWLGLAPGWGKYFMAIHGLDKRHEREFLPADWVLDRLPIRSNYLYGVVGMAIRWAVCFAPAIFLMHGLEGALLLSPALGLLVGFAYWMHGFIGRQFGAEDTAVSWAEMTAGVLLAGFLL